MVTPSAGYFINHWFRSVRMLATRATEKSETINAQTRLMKESKTQIAFNNDILKVIKCNSLKLEFDAKMGKTNWLTDKTKASTKQKCPNSVIICSFPPARRLVLLACLQPHVAYISHHALPLPRSL